MTFYKQKKILLITTGTMYKDLEMSWVYKLSGIFKSKFEEFASTKIYQQVIYCRLITSEYIGEII